MGQTKFVVSIVMIVIFAIAITTYAVNFGEDNDAAIKVADNQELSTLKSNLEDQAGKIRGNFTESDASFQTAEIKSGDENLEKGNLFKSTVTSPRIALESIGNATSETLFGGDTRFAIIINMFIGVIILIGLLYVWKTWKGGNPD